MTATANCARERVLGVALPVLTGVLVLAGWQAATRVLAIPAVLLPAPADVAAAFAQTAGSLGRDALATGSESLWAFLLSAVTGAAVALVLAASAPLSEACRPHLVIFQIIPKIALAPLFVLWLGYDWPQRLTYAVFISFFPVALATATGLQRADANALRLARALTASRLQTLFRVRAPYALPYFCAGVKIAATMSVIGIVVGEFISSERGLGHAILAAQSRSETAQMFAALAVLCVTGLVPYGIAMAAERLARAWWRG